MRAPGLRSVTVQVFCAPHHTLHLSLDIWIHSDPTPMKHGRGCSLRKLFPELIQGSQPWTRKAKPPSFQCSVAQSRDSILYGSPLLYGKILWCDESLKEGQVLRTTAEPLGSKRLFVWSKGESLKGSRACAGQCCLSKGASLQPRAPSSPCHPGEPLWEHTRLDLHLPFIVSPQAKLFLLQGSSENGGIE